MDMDWTSFALQNGMLVAKMSQSKESVTRAEIDNFMFPKVMPSTPISPVNSNLDLPAPWAECEIHLVRKSEIRTIFCLKFFVRN